MCGEPLKYRTSSTVRRLKFDITQKKTSTLFDVVIIETLMTMSAISDVIGIGLGG